ncbi:MAG: hypothetical protein ACHREM_06295 [Polyangiales bacterium]
MSTKHHFRIALCAAVGVAALASVAGCSSDNSSTPVTNPTVNDGGTDTSTTDTGSGVHDTASGADTNTADTTSGADTATDSATDTKPAETATETGSGCTAPVSLTDYLNQCSDPAVATFALANADPTDPTCKTSATLP